MIMRGILLGILVLIAIGIGVLSYEAYWWRRQATGASDFVRTAIEGAANQTRDLLEGLEDWKGTNTYGAPFSLIDQHGQPITEAAFRGQPSAVFFGFTHCPEVCPTTLFELDGWLKKLGDEGKNIRAYFVSVDPERDTAEIMNTYVGNVSDRITGITGEPEKVLAMAKSFNIFWRKVDTGDGDYTMDHTASVLLLHGSGDFAGTIGYGENPDTALAKLKRLAEEG